MIVKMKDEMKRLLYQCYRMDDYKRGNGFNLNINFCYDYFKLRFNFYYLKGLDIVIIFRIILEILKDIY